jgi:hypothetical protein
MLHPEIQLKEDPNNNRRTTQIRIGTKFNRSPPRFPRIHLPHPDTTINRSQRVKPDILARRSLY